MKFLLAFLISTASLFAFEGPYVGAGIGLSNTSAQYDFTGRTRLEFQKAGDSRSSLAVNFFTGYGWLWNKFFIAPELSLDLVNQEITPFDSTDSDENSRTLKVSLKRTWTAALGMRFGYVIKPDVLAYIGLGLSYTPWRLTILNHAFDQTTVEAKPDTYITKKNAAFAVNPSVGLEILLSKRVFGRVNYTIALPIRMSCDQNINNVGGFTTFDDTRLHHTLKPMTHTFTIGVGVRF